MGMFDDVEGIPKRPLVLFFVIDTSSSMAGTKIEAVNTAMREVISELKNVYRYIYDLKIACLTFSAGCKWMYQVPVSVESFQWNSVCAGGSADLGAACEELASKLSEDEFLKTPSNLPSNFAYVTPIIFLMSDGKPTDDYKSGIEKLEDNDCFKYADIIAVSINDDADQDVLAEFTGNAGTVINGVHNMNKLVMLAFDWIYYMPECTIDESIATFIAERLDLQGGGY